MQQDITNRAILTPFEIKAEDVVVLTDEKLYHQKKFKSPRRNKGANHWTKKKPTIEEIRTKARRGIK